MKLEVTIKSVMKMSVVSGIRVVDMFPVMVIGKFRNSARTDSAASLWLFGFLWLIFLIKHGHSVGNSFYICPSVFPGWIVRIVGIPH